MRKIILFEQVSLDGFVAGANGAMDWIRSDDDLSAYVQTIQEHTDAALYGRVTFDDFNAFWPTVLDDPASPEDNKKFARWYTAATKYVVSRTLQSSDADKRVVIGDSVAEQIEAIKQQPGKDIWMMGSPTIAQLLMRHNLIDEFWLNVSPVVLGSGLPLFADADDTLRLNLIAARSFPCGVIALRYGV